MEIFTTPVQRTNCYVHLPCQQKPKVRGDGTTGGKETTRNPPRFRAIKQYRTLRLDFSKLLITFFSMSYWLNLARIAILNFVIFTKREGQVAFLPCVDPCDKRLHLVWRLLSPNQL